MSETLIVRKEVMVKEDGRIVILYSFERALTPHPCPAEGGRAERAAGTYPSPILRQAQDESEESSDESTEETAKA